MQAAGRHFQLIFAALASVAAGAAATQLSTRLLIAGLLLTLLAFLASFSLVRGNAGVFLGLAIGLALLHGFLLARGADERLWNIALGVTLLGALALSLGKGGLSFKGVDAMVLLMAAAAVAATANTIARYGPDQTMRGARAWLVIPVLYWIGRRLALEKRSFQAAAVLSLVTLGIVFAYGWKQFFLGHTAAELALVDTEKFSAFVGAVPRLSSTLTTNQDLAAVSVVTVPVLFALAVSRHSNRWVWSATIALAASGAALTTLGMVRSAVVAVLAGCLAVLAFSGRLPRGRLPAAAFLVTLCSLALYLAVAPNTEAARAVKDRLSTFAHLGQDEAVRARATRIWPEVVSAIREEPLGHGVATTGGPAVDVLPRDEVITPDNGYLTAAYELGVQGMVALLGFLVALGVLLIRRARSGELHPLTVGALGSLCAASVAMMAGSFIQLTTFQMLLFPLAGAVVTMSERAE